MWVSIPFCISSFISAPSLGIILFFWLGDQNCTLYFFYCPIPQHVPSYCTTCALGPSLPFQTYYLKVLWIQLHLLFFLPVLPIYSISSCSLQLFSSLSISLLMLILSHHLNHDSTFKAESLIGKQTWPEFCDIATIIFPSWLSSCRPLHFDLHQLCPLPFLPLSLES